MQTTVATQAQPTYVITRADKERQSAIARAWQAFDDELEASLEPMEDEDPELANVAENIVSSCVEDVLSFLFGDTVEITVDKGAPPEAQKALDDVWGRKEARLPLLQECGQNGLLSGQGFLRLVSNRDGSIQLRAIDPSTIFVQRAPEDCKSVLLYCIEYCTDEEVNGHPLQRFYREEIRRIDPPAPPDDDRYADVNADGQDVDVSWELQHWTRIGNEGAWTAVGAPIPWPYSYCPIQSCQNLVRANSFWGKPDTTKGLITLNRAINFVLSNVNKIGKLYAQPIIWTIGGGIGTMDVALGKIAQLPPEAQIGVLQIPSDLANQLLFLEKLHSAVERQTSVPSMASGVTANMPGQIAGITLKTMCMALLKLVDKKRCLYGRLIINVSKAILQLKGFSPDIVVSLGWQNPLPSDGATDVQEALGLYQLGVSRKTLMAKLGYNYDEEVAQRKLEEATAAPEAMPPQPQGMPPASVDNTDGQDMMQQQEEGQQ